MSLMENLKKKKKQLMQAEKAEPKPDSEYPAEQIDEVKSIDDLKSLANGKKKLRKKK